LSALADRWRVSSLALSAFRLRGGCTVPPWATILKASLRSRTVGFPESGSDLGCPPQACPAAEERKRQRACAPALAGLPAGSSRLPETRPNPARCPVAVRRPGPPSAQGSFARFGRNPLRRDVQRLVGGRYPTLIAPTSPCARPTASRRLRLPSHGGSSQVVAAPCCQWVLPGVISAIPAWVLGPLPRGAPSVHLPVTSRRASASPYLTGVRHAGHPPMCNFDGGKSISGLQSFHHVQAPMLARPSGCTHHGTFMVPGRPGRLRHAELTRLPDMSRDIATRLNRANGAAGLSPAGSRPCRLLRQAAFPARPGHLRARSPGSRPGLSNRRRRSAAPGSGSGGAAGPRCRPRMGRRKGQRRRGRRSRRPSGAPARPGSQIKVKACSKERYVLIRLPSGRRGG